MTLSQLQSLIYSTLIRHYRTTTPPPGPLPAALLQQLTAISGLLVHTFSTALLKPTSSTTTLAPFPSTTPTRLQRRSSRSWVDIIEATPKMELLGSLKVCGRAPGGVSGWSRTMRIPECCFIETRMDLVSNLRSWCNAEAQACIGGNTLF